jgi:hypothetical protein
MVSKQQRTDGNQEDQGRILICGTGRAGTSFLVRLLTYFGEDTGFSPERESYFGDVRAGCEHAANGWDDVALWEKLPRIVKSPYLSTSLHLVPVPIEHILIPVRDIDDATKSREGEKLHWPGVDDQRKKNCEVLGECIAACVTIKLPFTIIPFEVLTSNPMELLDLMSPSFTSLPSGEDFAKAYHELKPERKL